MKAITDIQSVSRGVAIVIAALALLCPLVSAAQTPSEIIFSPVERASLVIYNGANILVESVYEITTSVSDVSLASVVSAATQDTELHSSGLALLASSLNNLVNNYFGQAYRGASIISSAAKPSQEVAAVATKPKAIPAPVSTTVAVNTSPVPPKKADTATPVAAKPGTKTTLPKASDLLNGATEATTLPSAATPNPTAASTVGGVSASSTASGTLTRAEVDTLLAALEKKLSAKIYSSGGGVSYVNALPQAVSLAQRIDKISNATISGSTITDTTVSGSLSGTFSGAVTATSESTLATTTITALTLTGESTLASFNFTNATGTSATTTNFATTNLNVSGAGVFSSTLTVSGASSLGLLTFTNATGTNATTTTFFANTLSTPNLFATSTATLGTTTITNLAVTNTSTSTIAGGLTIDTSGFVYQKATGRVGIGTVTPGGRLDVLDASNPQLRLTQSDGTIYTDFKVAASTGDLTVSINPSGSASNVTFNQPGGSTGANVWVCQGTSCPTLSISTGGNLIVENGVYIGNGFRLATTTLADTGGTTAETGLYNSQGQLIIIFDEI